MWTLSHYEYQGEKPENPVNNLENYLQKKKNMIQLVQIGKIYEKDVTLNWKNFFSHFQQR